MHRGGCRKQVFVLARKLPSRGVGHRICGSAYPILRHMKVPLRFSVLHHSDERPLQHWLHQWFDLDKVDRFAAHLGEGGLRSLDGGVLAFLFGLTALVVLGYNAG